MSSNAESVPHASEFLAYSTAFELPTQILKFEVISETECNLQLPGETRSPERQGPCCQHQLGAAAGHGCPVFLGFPLPGGFISYANDDTIIY